MGMGGAGVATVNDETALLINPAGLGRLRDYYITVADPLLEGGANSAKTMGLNATRMGDPQYALSLANKHPNQNLHERAQLFPSIVVPNFGLGLLANYSVDAKVNSTTSTYSYFYRRDVAAVFGLDFRFWNGIIKFGVSSRVVDRTEALQPSLSPTATNLKLTNLATGGLGIGVDGGMLLTAPIAWLPTLGAVYRDIGRTSYAMGPSSLIRSSTRPNGTPSTVDVGLSIHPILAKKVRASLTAQYDDILTYSKETSQIRRLHAGAEINFADALFIRGGMNQRYWTAGLELAIINYQVQIVSYGEDIGTAAAPVEDRRYGLKFAFRF